MCLVWPWLLEFEREMGLQLMQLNKFLISGSTPEKEM